MFEYYVFTNEESIKMLKTLLNTCLSETLCNEEKTISYLNEGEELLSKSYIFLYETNIVVLAENILEIMMNYKSICLLLIVLYIHYSNMPGAHIEYSWANVLY